jgi:predicted nucleic acid-binding Zn ribbon protein
LAPALESLRDELAPATLLADVQRLWPETVGSAVAAEATPTTERAGVVTVSCSAAVWAQELDLLAPEIVELLNRKLGERRVERLRCIAV